MTINSDGTIIKNSTGYTAQLKPQRVSDNIFYAGVFSDTSSAALRAISGGSNGSDYLVIGQDQTAEGNLIIVTSTKKIAIYECTPS